MNSYYSDITNTRKSNQITFEREKTHAYDVKNEIITYLNLDVEGERVRVDRPRS